MALRFLINKGNKVPANLMLCAAVGNFLTVQMLTCEFDLQVTNKVICALAAFISGEDDTSFLSLLHGLAPLPTFTLTCNFGTDMIAATGILWMIKFLYEKQKHLKITTAYTLHTHSEVVQ